MFENEGTGIDDTNDVNLADPSPATDDAQPDAAQPEQNAQAAAPKTQEAPFHEHPRWKEVMAERNAEREASAQLKAELAEMRRQIQESQKPKDSRPDFQELRTKMSKRFEGIDPETQAYFSSLEEQALSAKEELRQFREEQFVNRAVSRFDELNKTNAVPTELVGVYKAQLDLAYREGKIRNMEDLEKIYRTIHEPISKLLSDREKASIEKYTTEKKKTATQPATQPKGKAAAPGQGPRTFANEQDRRAAMIKEAVTELRASRDTG